MMVYFHIWCACVEQEVNLFSSHQQRPEDHYNPCQQPQQSGGEQATWPPTSALMIKHTQNDRLF